MNRLLEQHQKVCDLWSRFLMLMQAMFCGRCLRDQWPEQARLSRFKGHTRGAAIDFFASRNIVISELKLSSFMSDTEHGFFHGLCTAFHFFLLERERFATDDMRDLFVDSARGRARAENELLTCLVHDFHRVVVGPAGHDQELQRWFHPDQLDRSTLTHSKPPEITPLVLADRLELQRYPDWGNWFNKNMTPGVSDSTWNLSRHFNKFLRPGLELLYEHRNGRWLRHGVEIPENYDFQHVNTFPQLGGFHKSRSSDPERILSPAYAVEFGRLYDSCLLEHVSGREWLGWFGLLPFETYYEVSNLVPCDYDPSPKMKQGLGRSRDHMAARGAFVLDDWVFVAARSRFVTKLTRDLLAAGHGVQPFGAVDAFLRIGFQFENLLLGLRS